VLEDTLVVGSVSALVVEVPLFPVAEPSVTVGSVVSPVVLVVTAGPVVTDVTDVVDVPVESLVVVGVPSSLQAPRPTTANDSTHEAPPKFHLFINPPPQQAMANSPQMERSIPATAHGGAHALSEAQ